MRNQPYDVVGVTFEGRQEILDKFFKNTYKIGGSYAVRLVREPDNKYDKNAVAVYLDLGGSDFKQVGYISKQENQKLIADFGKMKTASVASMGPNSFGDIGLTIKVEFDD